MNLDLSNKTALVCGGSQGLGFAVANELALLNATIILLSRSEDKLKEAVKKLPANAQQQHSYISADTSKPAEVKEKLQQYLQQNSSIHILINNSGGPASGPALETKAEDFTSSFQSHLITAHTITQLVVPGMKQAGFGRIINILSTSIKEPINHLVISNSVRAAVANWAKTLANDLAQFGITVNNVLPGYTKTDRLKYLFGKQAESNQTTVDAIEQKQAEQIPAKRLGIPEEFGAVVAFLCSPAAGYVNGVNLPVDGGALHGL